MRLYVGNLAWAMTDSDLTCLFSQYGKVESAKIITQPSGKSRGYGFVEMQKEGEALVAIDRLHKAEVFGREIIVTVGKKNNIFSPKTA